MSLYQSGRYSQALQASEALAAQFPGFITAWNLLGHVQRDIGAAAAAAAAFDRALELDARDPAALKGRARLALERAESDVGRRYAHALALLPDDPQLVLEQTEARLTAGDTSAVEAFESFVRSRPEWSEGHLALARLLWEVRRDPGFAEPVLRLLRRDPGRFDLWRGLIDLFSSLDLHAAAADLAAQARRTAGASNEFLLMEAVQAGRSGDLGRADALLRMLPPELPGRALHDATHQIRRQAPDAALTHVERALADNPADIAAWAIAELLFRTLGDPRAEWLSGQAGLVQTLELDLASERLDAIKALLLRLHGTGVQMAGQSVRDGTQTRWRLFDRTEPELAEFRAAQERAIGAYVAALPDEDARHPLLRHRNAPLAITGSWSVRLTGGGHHVSHIHHLGLLSSACHLQVPPQAGGDRLAGALELGRPPADLLLDLEPLQIILPRPSRLILFPSFLHHGTRPFTVGERLSVALDVNRHPAPPL